ncbi:hypothetical protein PRUPE_1G087500 [Prunus persica]|uniref:Uncharacterized protein n=1 Tax=Prunus persica TaxID=3760 RepID=A0A251QUE4_PRUPE|nr:hypothetical protein PRUPE_1G087500 [Prunus persica]
MANISKLHPGFFYLVEKSQPASELQFHLLPCPSLSLLSLSLYATANNLTSGTLSLPLLPPPNPSLSLSSLLLSLTSTKLKFQIWVFLSSFN